MAQNLISIKLRGESRLHRLWRPIPEIQGFDLDVREDFKAVARLVVQKLKSINGTNEQFDFTRSETGFDLYQDSTHKGSCFFSPSSSHVMPRDDVEDLKRALKDKTDFFSQFFTAYLNHAEEIMDERGDAFVFAPLTPYNKCFDLLDKDFIVGPKILMAGLSPSDLVINPETEEIYFPTEPTPYSGAVAARVAHG